MRWSLKRDASAETFKSRHSSFWRSQMRFGQVDVWRIPYHESTLVLDVIDPHTNQLVWRGYDTRTIDFEKSEKTIHKSVEKVTKRFKHDVDEQRKKIR